MSASADFAKFKAECNRWQARLGLFDWQITFEHEPRKRTSEDGLSTIYCDSEARHAKLVYRHRGQRDMTIGDIAKHEMLHLLFNDFAKMVAARADDMHRDAIREEHKVIERLMRAFK